VFLFCTVLSGGFLLISTLLGTDHSDIFHAGSHAAHIHLGGHVVGHAGHAGHMSHVGGHGAHGAAHASGHAGGQAHAAGQGSASSTAPNPLQSYGEMLLSGLNLYSLLLFLFVFGLLGYLLHNLTHVGVVFSILLPLLVGVVFGTLVGNLLMRMFTTSPGSILGSETSQLEGRLGTVSIAIREGGIGEILFSRPGIGRQSLGARSSDGQPIDKGAEIVVLGYEKGIATVQTWDRFLLQTRAGEQPLLKPLDPQP
jgi:hypothetical protein